jgi:hypothetical protein
MSGRRGLSKEIEAVIQEVLDSAHLDLIAGGTRWPVSYGHTSRTASPWVRHTRK